MALTVTSRGFIWNTTAGNKSPTAFTPAVGDILVVFVANSGRTTAQAPTVADNLTGGTYTKVGSDMTKNTSADSGWWFIRDNPVASASSCTVTVTQSSDTGGGCQVWSVGPMNAAGSGKVRGKGKQDNQAAGTPSLTLDQTPLSVNAILGAVFTGSNTTTNTAPPTNFTEANDNGYNSPTSGLETVHRASGHTSTTVAWTAATASAFGSSAIEISSLQDVAPSLLSQAAVATAPTVSTSNTIAPALKDQTATLSAPTVTSLATIAPALLDRTAVATAPTSVLTATQTVAPALLDRTATATAPLVGPPGILPALLDRTASATAPLVGPPGLSLSLITQTATASGPAVSAVATVALGVIDRTASATAPAVTPGAVVVSPALIDRTASPTAPTITSQATIAPALLSQTAAATAPSVSATYGVAPPLIDRTAASSAPTIAAGAVTISLSTIDRTATPEEPLVEVQGGPANVVLQTISATASTFAPTIVPAQFVAPSLLDATAAAVAPTVTTAAGIGLSLIDQTAAASEPIVGPPGISLGTIDQTAAASAPNLTAVFEQSINFNPPLGPGPQDPLAPSIVQTATATAPRIARVIFPTGSDGSVTAPSSSVIVRVATPTADVDVPVLTAEVRS